MSPHSVLLPNSPPLSPSFNPSTATDSPTTKTLIKTLSFLPHPEGGFFVETDRDTLRVPNPFLPSSASTTSHGRNGEEEDDSTRSASTTIHYLLTPSSPLGHFHRNRARTVHTLHKGRGRYVIIHADEVAGPEYPGGYARDQDGEDGKEEGRWMGKARVETFVVGQNVLAGEKLQWIVDGGKYKASFLLSDAEDGEGSEEGLLISETVVPGFEFCDHDFLTRERFDVLVGEELKRELEWMVQKD